MSQFELFPTNADTVEIHAWSNNFYFSIYDAVSPDPRVTGSQIFPKLTLDRFRKIPNHSDPNRLVSDQLWVTIESEPLTVVTKNDGSSRVCHNQSAPDGISDNDCVEMSIT